MSDPRVELETERAVPWRDPGLYAWHRARYERALAAVAGKEVLDLDCGEGYGAALLAERALRVVGIDYSTVAIEHARRTYDLPNLRFEGSDATALDPALGRFDVATCFEVLEHVGDPKVLLRTAVRRPGGHLYLSTPNARLERLYESVTQRPHCEYHVSSLTVGELRRLARRDFSHFRLYGQAERGGTLHAVLKGLDVLNLRHRLVRSPAAQGALAAAVGKPPIAVPALRFSRLLVRQSPIVLLVAQRR